jgi:hypothetical protein
VTEWTVATIRSDEGFLNLSSGTAGGFTIPSNAGSQPAAPVPWLSPLPVQKSGPGRAAARGDIDTQAVVNLRRMLGRAGYGLESGRDGKG